MKRSIPRLLRLVSSAGFPFLLGGSAHVPMVRLRRAAIHQRLSRHRLSLRILVRIVMLFGWPIVAARTSLAALRGPFGRALGGTPLQRTRRAIAAYASALLHNMPAFSYFSFRLYEPDRERTAPLFLFATDVPGLAALNDLRGANNEDVQDKLRFASLCSEHALPCIETLAAFRGGKQLLPAAPFVPTQSALWVKPIRGAHGDGAARWRRISGCYVNQAGQRCSAEELLEYCRQQDCLLQPVLENHPTLTALSDGRIVDVRIVTGIERDGSVQIVIDPVVRLPYAGLPWQHVPIQGLVDARSGRIVRAYMEVQAMDHHPDSGAGLLDQVLPDWAAAMALVHRAHAQAFSRFVFLGWDVALTSSGPLLIECNSGWGAEFVQWQTGQPLGNSRFGEILHQYL
jgi:hypothetical protein